MEKQASTILIVDDIPENIQVVGSILKARNYMISFAQSGQKALELTEKKSYDLILLDIMMPGMSGFEVCETLKKRTDSADIPIIFLTARDDEESITRGFELGAVDYITKPFNRSELLARVKTHLQINEQKKKLEELNATKDKFFSIIAHDLKNFFNAILGFGDVLLEEMHSSSLSESEEFVRIIRDSAESGFSLLENLLQWARSQTGSLVFTPGVFLLKEMVEETVTHLTSIAGKKQISIETALSEQSTVYGDQNMLMTVVRNIVSNAIKFTPQGGNISLFITPAAKDEVCLVIRDTGVGMDADILNNLFQLDKNVSRIGTDNESGTGLGLILCKDFMEKNGGHIRVESKLGQGTSFMLYLRKDK